MITVITSTGDQAGSGFSPRFGRAGWFCVYNEETGQAEFIKNRSLDEPGHVGPGAANQVIALGAEKVISGDFGPRVSYLLERSNVQMVMIQNDQYTVQDIIDRLRSSR